jgi:hypothetical protein
MKPKTNIVATILEYREVYDRPARLEELVPLLRDLDLVTSASLLCQMNADFRLTKREREATAKTQQEIAGGLLPDETINRLKERFGKAHMSDRPIFYPAQMLNVLRLVFEHSVGTRNPLAEDSARYALGEACLMMNDLMMTERERKALAPEGEPEEVRRALMVQMLAPFELLNTSNIAHVAYRSRIMFRELLAKKDVVERISQQCQGFDFEREFLRIAKLPLQHWLLLMIAFYSYLAHYLGPDGVRHHEFLAIDRTQFGKDTPIPQAELDAALATVSATPDALKRASNTKGAGDWRLDTVPFRSKPLIELESSKFHCADIGLLVEKIHSGVFWTIHDGLSNAERPMLSSAWGILFEEYVNWFLSERRFKNFSFWPRPRWTDGTEALDGAFMRDTVFMPMEYKGGFLLREARYSGDVSVFEEELESKIIKGCKQLVRKIEALFHKRPGARKELRSIDVKRVTRVVPLLVVQDHILGGPLVNWMINKRFNEILDRTLLRPEVKVDALNVIGIRELETMAESAEAGLFDLFHGLQYKCYADPEMVLNLHNFLGDQPGYGEGKSRRISTLLEKQLKEATEYLFGRKRKKGRSQEQKRKRKTKTKTRRKK